MLQAFLVHRDKRLGEPLDRLLVVDLEVIVGAVRPGPDAQHGNLHQLADLDALQHFLERGLAKRLVGIAGTAESKLRVGPGVDVAGGHAHAELGEETRLCAIDRRRIEVAVQSLLKHALVNLDRIDAGGLGAAALRLEVAAETRVVRVVSRRRESIAEVSSGPVTDAVLDVHGLQELERGGPIEIALQSGGIRQLRC